MHQLKLLDQFIEDDRNSSLDDFMKSDDCSTNEANPFQIQSASPRGEIITPFFAKCNKSFTFVKDPPED